MKEEIPRSQCVDLGRRTMPGFLFLRHEDKFGHGVPDLTITGLKKTSWWEFKLADENDGFPSEGIQELTMKRLAAYGGIAFYVIYKQIARKQYQAFIVHPDDLSVWKTMRFESPVEETFPHHWVLKFMWEQHAKIARV